jgi:hypothetical protein
VRTTVERVTLDPDPPTPADCLPPGEEPAVVVALDHGAGWIALTEREVLVYHPTGDPPLTRVPEPNVTALAVERVGGEAVVSYVPQLFVFGLGSLLAGILLRGFGLPTAAAGSAEQVASLLSLLAGALATVATGLSLLGVVLLAGALGAVALVVYLRGPVLAVERGEADPVTCPTTEREGRRALSDLSAGFETLEEPTDQSLSGTGGGVEETARH